MRIATLICHRDVPMALRCLASLAWSVDGAQLVLHDDGSLTAQDVASLRDALPVARVVGREEADDAMRGALGAHRACARARAGNVLMRKLFDIPLLSGGDIRYCDTDVLFRRRTEGLLQWKDGDPAAIFMRDRGHAYAARPWHLMGAQAMRLPQFLNSGLFMVRREAYDLDFLEQLLARDAVQRIFAHVPVWAEQTCWAALALRAGCGLWDGTLVAVVHERWRASPQTVAAHFVSSSRSRLNEPLPEPIQATARVPVSRAVPCTAITLARAQIARRLRRACGF